MAASGTTKWMVAAFLIVLVGTVLTVYELTQSDPIETAKQTPNDEAAKEDVSLTDDPLFDEPAGPVFVVPSATKDASLLEQPPGRLPAPLRGLASSHGATRIASAEQTLPIRREGAALTDVRGAVARVGNRYEFRPADGSAPLILLENQLLERILYLQQHGGPGPASNAWILSGVVTEFQQSNYFLVQLMKID